MDEKIQQQLQIDKIAKMKNPTILMNHIDLKDFMLKLESNIAGFKIPINPTYEGNPIKGSDAIKRGEVIVYDDIY